MNRSAMETLNKTEDLLTYNEDSMPSLHNIRDHNTTMDYSHIHSKATSKDQKIILIEDKEEQNNYSMNEDDF